MPIWRLPRSPSAVRPEVSADGKYATRIGNYRNGICLSADHKTMAHYFNEAGYYTGYIGKWHLGSTRHAVPKEERGEYQYWLGANALEATSTAYDTLVYDNDDQPVHLPGYRVDALADAAIRFVDRNKEKPFFLFLSFLEPHFQNSNDSFPAPDVYKNTPARLHSAGSGRPGRYQLAASGRLLWDGETSG